MGADGNDFSAAEKLCRGSALQKGPAPRSCAGSPQRAMVALEARTCGYQQLTAVTWAAVLQITLGAAVIANVSWLWAVSRGGLVRIAPIQFAQPVCALRAPQRTPITDALAGRRLHHRRHCHRLPRRTAKTNNKGTSYGRAAVHKRRSIAGAAGSCAHESPAQVCAAASGIWAGKDRVIRTETCSMPVGFQSAATFPIGPQPRFHSVVLTSVVGTKRSLTRCNGMSASHVRLIPKASKKADINPDFTVVEGGRTPLPSLPSKARYDRMRL